MTKNEAWYKYDLPRIDRELADVDLYYQPEVDSTNDWARQAATSRVRKRTSLFLATQQTAGRGRGDHRWFSGPGSLTFSLLMGCDLELQNPVRPLLSLATGCGICEALSQLGFECGLKWPNDVIYKQRKLAGVLIESLGKSQIIVGCGINVNNDVSSISDAISLREKVADGTDISEVLAYVVPAIMRRIDGIETSTRQLLADLRSYDWLTAKAVKWVNGATVRTGTAIGIADDGALLLETKDGAIAVHSGSIFALPEI